MFRLCVAGRAETSSDVRYGWSAAYAASNSSGSMYLSPRAMIAHAIRVILLAKATASHLGRSTRHRPPRPRMLLRTVLLRMTAMAPETKPPQVSIALLRNDAELVFAAGRVLLRYKPDPG